MLRWLQKLTDERHVIQNAVRPGVRPCVPPEMAEGDFRLMIYQTTVQQFTIKRTDGKLDHYIAPCLRQAR